MKKFKTINKMSYCTKCGKRKRVAELTHLCKTCHTEQNRRFREEEKEEKQREKEVENTIKKVFKINDKIRELEKIFKVPCGIDVDIANIGQFIFGNFVKRRFRVIPRTKGIVSKLKGEYKSIDEFWANAEKLGFEIDKYSGTEFDLTHKNKTYYFTTHGIYLKRHHLGVTTNMYSKKIAEIEYSLWNRR